MQPAFLLFIKYNGSFSGHKVTIAIMTVYFRGDLSVLSTSRFFNVFSFLKLAPYIYIYIYLQTNRQGDIFR